MIVFNNGLPFDVKIPTKETKKALDELKQKEGKTFNSIDELFEENIENESSINSTKL